MLGTENVYVSRGFRPIYSNFAAGFVCLLAVTDCCLQAVFASIGQSWWDRPGVTLVYALADFVAKSLGKGLQRAAVSMSVFSAPCMV